MLCGHARFEIAGEPVDAPAGTLIAVPVGVPRRAVAAEASTTVVVIGAAPGGALPVSPFEHWYLAEPAYQRGDYAEAYEIAARGLADWPDHGHLNYQLACYKALAEDRERAISHLDRAFRGNPETRGWAAGDDDLANVRDDPALRP